MIAWAAAQFTVKAALKCHQAVPEFQDSLQGIAEAAVRSLSSGL